MMGDVPTTEVTKEIPYTDTLIPAYAMEWPLPVPSGTVIITAMALRYRLADGR